LLQTHFQIFNLKKKLYLSPWGNCKARGLVQVIFHNKDKNDLINNNDKGKNK